MFRVKIIMVVVGGVLGYMGFQEFLVSRGTSVEPAAVDLSKLEAGEAVPNNHVRIGEHIAVYAGCVYEYEQSKYESGDPNSSTKVTHLFYPIISKTQAAKGIDNFAVMVKTNQFKTIGAIPKSDFSEVTSIQGLIINEIDGLDSKEKDLVRSNFASIDFDKVLILEANRQPASLVKSLGMTLGGGVIALLGIAWFFVGRKSAEA